MPHEDLSAHLEPSGSNEENSPPTGFTDVFISYSRTDKAFVQHLTAALRATQRTVWVDWHDILPAEDFLQAIYAGIDAAGTFVFVLSPDSLRSGACLKEVLHAVEGKKRIIPLVYREVNAQTVFEPLQPLNWIDFSRDDLFPVAFAQLLFALQTDLDYWHLSARLLARARLWEGKHDRSLTLRGKELKEAERWQREGGTKKPPAGPPVTTFIAASLQQRTRARVLSSLVTLLVLLAAGSALYLFRNPFLTPNLVSNLNDTGPGSLRVDIADARPGSTITFASNLRGAITLSQSLSIPRDLTIAGPGAGTVSITNDKYSVVVEAQTKVTLSDLAFHVQIANSGTLALQEVSVSGVTVQGDQFADGAHGAGIYNAGTLSISNSTISGNSVVGRGGGGGIYNDGGTLKLSHSTISGNSVGYGGGGGIANVLGANAVSGTAIISNSTISGNTAHGFNGGGILNDEATLSISNSTISGNTADGGDGGGLATGDNGGTSTISDSTISENTASDTSATQGNGGAIVNGVGALTLVNSTIFGNSAADAGGGIFDSAGSNPVPTTANIVYSTLYGNKAATGGGMAGDVLDVHVQVRNSILVGNQSHTSPAITGTLTTEGYNLFQNVDPGALLFADPDHKHGTDKAVTDLSFISSTLQTSKGPDGKPAPSQTLALLNIPSNPAIDAIPPGNDCTITITITDAVTGTSSTLTVDHDQRGVPRPYGPGCDIGAYEYNSV
jgi:hypothetical protein